MFLFIRKGKAVLETNPSRPAVCFRLKLIAQNEVLWPLLATREAGKMGQNVDMPSLGQDDPSPGAGHKAGICQQVRGAWAPTVHARRDARRRWKVLSPAWVEEGDSDDSSTAETEGPQGCMGPCPSNHFCSRPKALSTAFYQTLGNKLIDTLVMKRTVPWGKNEDGMGRQVAQCLSD